MALPDNLPGWARTGLQWAVIGVVAGYVYQDMSRDVKEFKQVFASMNTQLDSINRQIGSLDVDRAAMARAQKDIEDLRADVRSLLEWRRALNATPAR